MECDILIKGARVLTPDMEVAEGRWIAVADGRILAMGEGDPAGYQAPTVIDDARLLWMPGLTDAHLHTSQQFLKGSLLDERPVIWKRINVPFEASLTERTMALSARLAAAEMIRCGTTSFVDAGGPHVEAAAREYLAAGMRGALTWQTTDGAGVPPTLRVETADAVPRLERLHKDLDGAGGGLVKTYFSVTSLMACTEELFSGVFGAARDLGIPAECHMNEYASEVMDFIAAYHERPFEYLERRGLVPERFVAAHCIMLSDAEVDVIRDRGVRVVHCPFSNCGKGVPQTPRLLDAGVAVALGSDGAGHGGLDLFREMRAFRCVMNATVGLATANPQVMPARTLLSMATRGGAAALFEDELGEVRPGALADLIAIDLDQPHLMATGSLVNSLVESASGADVRHAVIGGRLVMRDRELLTIDEERLFFEVREQMAGNALLARAGAYCG